jgi:hypothetical protein
MTSETPTDASATAPAILDELDLSSIPAAAARATKTGRDPKTAATETLVARFPSLDNAKVIVFQLFDAKDTIRGVKTRVTRAATRAKYERYAVGEVNDAKLNGGKPFVFMRHATADEWTKELEARAKATKRADEAKAKKPAKK